MWIEIEASRGNREASNREASNLEAPTWRNTVASLVSGLVICATFLAALFIAGSP